MKTALFRSVNLIGDGLYISPALNAWYKYRGFDYDRLDLYTLGDHVKKIYYGMDVPLNVITETDREPYDFQHTFDVNAAFKLSDQKRQHLAQSYADLLGVALDVKPDNSHLKPIFHLPVEDYKTQVAPYAGSILVSMFSASCASRGNPVGPPNKMLPWHKWKPIFRAIRKQFPQTPIYFLGAPTDVVPDEIRMLAEPFVANIFGIPLDQLALIMRDSLFVVTLDNGMAHLAASQEAREFVFYPVALGQHYILPLGNPNMKFIHMNPMTLNPAQAVWELQQAWKGWGL